MKVWAKYRRYLNPDHGVISKVPKFLIISWGGGGGGGGDAKKGREKGGLGLGPVGWPLVRFR